MNILSLRGISQVLLGNKVLQGKFEKGHVVSIYIKVDLNNFLKAFNYKMFFNCQVLHLGSISLFFFFFEENYPRSRLFPYHLWNGKYLLS